MHVISCAPAQQLRRINKHTRSALFLDLTTPFQLQRTYCTGGLILMHYKMTLFQLHRLGLCSVKWISYSSFNIAPPADQFA
jgi:hypothetical protein